MAAEAPATGELVTGGAQSLKLCGAFGPSDTAAVLEATGGQVPIGVATYGMDSCRSWRHSSPTISTMASDSLRKGIDKRHWPGPARARAYDSAASISTVSPTLTSPELATLAITPRHMRCGDW